MEQEGKRLNKYIADAGYCSRHEADRLIEAGRVEIRSKSRKGEAEKPALKGIPGDRVFHGDTVYVNGHELPKKEPERVYYLYHKPRGVICTLDRSERGNIADAADLPQGITYAGRLDKDSSGLLLLTNDGEMVNQMMRASSFHEKEYLCTVDKPITEAFVQSMRSGVKIRLDDDEHLKKNPHGVYVTTRPCRVKKTGERSFSIVLTQGYNRQIRRMSASCGYNVVSLKRTRLMHLTLGDLKAGQMRQLKGPEVMRLKEAVTGSPRSKTGSRKEAVFSGKTDTHQKKSGTKRDDKRRI